MTEIRIDKLIRSRRKTIGLQITGDAKLIVRAPLFAPQNFIEELIQRKQSWIRAKQDFYKVRQRQVRRFIPGEEFLFLGQSYPLVAAEDLPKAIVFDGHLRISSLVLANARQHLESWYKAQAFEYIAQRVQHFAKLAGLGYKSIKINRATTRWGSCGPKDTLNFSWRLIMAPCDVVDYVVIHELMHLKQKNHSRKFWAEVAGMMPEYRQQERWLRAKGHLLAWPE
ncbi:MAG: M48 family metallopeptidase [Candidatus Omnitrophica bacterium]|nr:M48 family metallopeptidase [Candidatus Omnitrophota bacterium]MDE2009744.1 M48 family metallopeptidase [Candidatus Omnitrophota bacterium]MDE2213859.1 M48 family metallopeptidase [Candidatus Omnitrophota bacterium]MDE2231882.1 M48 family metallopeptidase [Candidatus Omnitrophota bacterium]